MKTHFLIMACLLVLCTVMASAETLVIDTIRGKASRDIRFAIPDFSGGSQGGTIAGVVREDLLRHGAFVQAPIAPGDLQLLDRADIQKGQIHFKNWANLQAQLLGKGSVSGSGTLTVEFALYTPESGARVFGKRYNAPGSQARRIGHLIADDIIEAILKEKGFFSSRLLFVKGDYTSKNVYICDSDGRDQKALTRGTSITVFPDWFPNKKDILFTSFYEGRPIIYKLDMQSAKTQRLLAMPGMNTSGAVSPDGRKLTAIIDKDGHPELYVFDIGGGPRTRLTRDRAAESSPTWSPDGRQIAYASDAGGLPQIYIISASGGTPRQISSGSISKYCTSPAWSPDGKKIAFVAKRGGNFDLFMYDFDSRQTVQLTTDSSNDENPSWARDSRHLAFCRASRRIILLDTETGKESTMIAEGQNCTQPVWEP